MCNSPTVGHSTTTFTLTSTTARMMVLFWRLDSAVVIALATFWICPQSPSFDPPSCSKDYKEEEQEQ